MDLTNGVEPWARDNLFKLTPGSFEAVALQLFQYQYALNPLYRRFVDLVSVPGRVQCLEDIPFLPVSFFKSHVVKTGDFREAIIFESSGTTGSVPSRHFIRDPQAYDQVSIRGFESVYGSLEDYCILALLPSYLERGSSSLVHMVQAFMNRSGHPLNGFYLHDIAALHQRLSQCMAAGQKTLLIGVTYALLDFAEAYPMPLSGVVVMETGGMKGRREELVRPEVHRRLIQAFSVGAIHSEYGMTELLSQAYAERDGMFAPPPWMRVLVGSEDDPGEKKQAGEIPGMGLLHVIDLANKDSCAFIATEDLCRLHPGGQFEVLGRLDNSDIRGCSLLAL